LEPRSSSSLALPELETKVIEGCQKGGHETTAYDDFVEKKKKLEPIP
jgi:hypothetical protein